MSGLPPPAGPPATMFPRPDPWLEQARREARHRAARARRRRRILVPILGLLAAAAAGVGVFVVISDDVAAPDATVDDTPATTTVEASAVPEPTIEPQSLVELDEVWLIDRGDGVYDWGVSVRTPIDAPRRSGVEIEVRLLDDSGELVEAFDGVVDGIDDDAAGAVAGRLESPSVVPVRIEFDIAVGETASEPGVADLLDVRALERDDDTVSGRIRSFAGESLDELTMLLLWHDEFDDVIAAVPVDVDRVRPDVDARFEVDVAVENVPDGRPDAVVWAT